MKSKGLFNLLKKPNVDSVTVYDISQIYSIGDYTFYIDQVEIKSRELHLLVYSNNDDFQISESDMQMLLPRKIDLFGIQNHTVRINEVSYTCGDKPFSTSCDRIMERNQQPIEMIKGLAELKKRGNIDWELAGKQRMVFKLDNHFEILKSLSIESHFERSYIKLDQTMTSSPINIELDIKIECEDNDCNNRVVLRRIETMPVNLHPHIYDRLCMSTEEHDKAFVDTVNNCDIVKFIFEVPETCESVYMHVEEYSTGMVMTSIQKELPIAPLWVGNKVVILEKGMMPKTKHEVAFHLGYLLKRQYAPKTIKIY